MTTNNQSVWKVVQAVAVVLVLGLFLFSVRGLLNPFLLFWILVLLLLPFRDVQGHGLIVFVAAILTLYWLLATTGFLLAPFVLGFVLAYMLDPMVDALEGRGVGRMLAIVLLTLPVVGLGMVLVLFGIPALIVQMDQLIEAAPTLLERVGGWVNGLRERILLANIPGLDAESLPDLRTLDPARVVTFLQERRSSLASGAWASVLGLGRGIGSVATLVGYVVLTPVLTFYLLRDYDHIVARVRELLPRSREAAIVDFATQYDALLAKYLRGQVTVAIILGLLTGVLLFVVRFPYPFLLGALVGILGLIPFLGLVLSIIPAIIVALVSGNVVTSLIKVAAVYGFTQILEGSFISPRIVGESVGLHPVWIVLALSVGGFFFGFVGLLVGVPAAVGVKLLVVRGLDSYRSSELFAGDGSGSVEGL
jgi:predicted PurR-regulated permease PerM